VSSACSRLLVANRGEIARRIFATAHRMGIGTVAVYAAGDAGAPFVAEADQAVALDGVTAAETYLNQVKVLEAAKATGADAIHPGYGFLAENAEFAAAVIAAGLTWVGPTPSAIAAAGDKLAAKRLMIAAGVPVLASVEVGGGGGAGLEAAGAEVGYPLLVKAAAGGGGKGMRVVTGEADLAPAVASAQREAAAAFGDGTVFLETYLPAARHVEIQVLGDQHGNLVHCFERECSIQRRHQKVIEEAPSPAVDPELRSALGDAALAAARVIDYHSAGTVEFLVAGRAFYFLEVNTRLQVEHPVTEEVTGLDLVRQQILIARGEPLAFTQAELAVRGHAIEARLYAEDVDAGYLPATGTLAAFAPPASPAARFDSGVETGSVVGVDFDPMLAKVIVHAPTRSEAAARLARVLERTTIAGVVTNRDLLVSTLRHPAFLAGDTTTDFLDRVGRAGTDGLTAGVRLTDGELARMVAALVLYRQAGHRSRAGVLGFMRSGYRNSVMPPEQVTLAAGGRDLAVTYRSRRDGTFDIDIDRGGLAGTTTGRVVQWCDGRIEAVIGGVRAPYDVVAAPAPDGVAWHVQSGGHRADLVERSRFPAAGGAEVAGGQRAPMPGTVRSVEVEAGQEVSRGQTLVVLEAMKMEHPVAAPGPALVAELRCAVGDQVGSGAVLVVLEPRDGGGET
jgi:propionyl-CoA carboxylase alpha chain